MSKTLAQSFVKYINEDLRQIKQPHFDIAWRLHEAKRLAYAAELGYSDIYELSEVEFGFKKSSTIAYIAVADTFMDSHMHVEPMWQQYSYSQLVEMLALDPYDRTRINPDMTVKQIRKYKQDHKFVTLENGDYVMYGELNDKQKTAYADFKERQKAEKQSDQTSGLENVEAVVANLQDFDKNISVASSGVVAKSALLGFKNKSEREKFLSDYKSWGVWLSVPELELTCYKYRFANGAELVVSESHCYDYYGLGASRRAVLIRYHLKDNDKRDFFDLSGIAKSHVLEYMTNKAKEI